jgi:hypothetical protein
VRMRLPRTVAARTNVAGVSLSVTMLRAVAVLAVVVVTRQMPPYETATGSSADAGRASLRRQC